MFEASTGIDESCRAQELMERLSGVAWLAMESLDLLDLKHSKSVERLLAHFWQELEPLEYLRIFCTLADFYKNFRRTPGQEYIAYDMEFRNHLKRLEEIGAKIEGLTKAYWFIEGFCTCAKSDKHGEVPESTVFCSLLSQFLQFRVRTEASSEAESEARVLESFRLEVRVPPCRGEQVTDRSRIYGPPW